MTLTKQKEAELWVLKDYMRRRDLCGKIKPRESPDFAIHSGNTVIGVEIVDYHQPQKTKAGFTMREVEAAWEHIRERVVECRKKLPALNNLCVYLRFEGRPPPAHSEVDSFIEAVASVVDLNHSQIGFDELTIKVRDDHPEVLQRHVLEITVNRDPSIDEWGSDLAFGWVGTDELELLNILQCKLDPKSKTACNLRKEGFDRGHLVLNEVRAWPSQIIGMVSVDQLNEYHQLSAALEASSFDEVCLLGEHCINWTRGAAWKQLD